MGLYLKLATTVLIWFLEFCEEDNVMVCTPFVRQIISTSMRVWVTFCSISNVDYKFVRYPFLRSNSFYTIGSCFSFSFNSFTEINYSLICLFHREDFVFAIDWYLL